MSFREIRLTLPPHIDAEVVGFLYDSDDPHELGQDMVEVRLPIGVTINAGWYPEGSLHGEYKIKTWGKIELPELFTENADDARQLIQTLVETLTSREPQPISDSFTTVHQSRCYAFA